MTAIFTDYQPDAITRVAFGHDLWDVPKQIMRSTLRPSARVAVKACHASSKTHTAADCVLVALLLGGDVLTTAPTWEQVETVLWGQVRAGIRDGNVAARDFGAVNLTDITMPSGEKAMGLSTNEGTRFQGWHARPDSFLLVIVDEATGVKPDIFQAIEGIAAGGDVRILLLGNPTVPSGYFFDIFDSQSPIWERITIDAFDTPNLLGLSLDDLLALPEHALDESAREYLVTRRWVRDRYLEWGVDHPEWQSRVRGQFPQNADVSLIWRSWLDDARGKDAKYAPENGPLVAGIDVAGPGDDETVLVVRQASGILRMEPFASPDPRGAVLAVLRDYLHFGLCQVNVDTAGIGWYFAQHLRSNLPESVVVGEINVGEAPTSDAAREKNFNLRAELYQGLRDRFRDGDVRGLTDALAISQLASIQYKHNDRGQVVIEKKDDARKRGVKSPDRAEALMLAFAPQNFSDRLSKALTESWR